MHTSTNTTKARKHLRKGKIFLQALERCLSEHKDPEQATIQGEILAEQLREHLEAAQELLRDATPEKPGKARAPEAEEATDRPTHAVYLDDDHARRPLPDEWILLGALDGVNSGVERVLDLHGPACDCTLCGEADKIRLLLKAPHDLVLSLFVLAGERPRAAKATPPEATATDDDEEADEESDEAPHAVRTGDRTSRAALPAERRLIHALVDGQEAAAEVMTAHGHACDCNVCTDAQGIEWMLEYPLSSLIALFLDGDDVAKDRRRSLCAEEAPPATKPTARARKPEATAEAAQEYVADAADQAEAEGRLARLLRQAIDASQGLLDRIDDPKSELVESVEWTLEALKTARAIISSNPDLAGGMPDDSGPIEVEEADEEEAPPTRPARRVRKSRSAVSLLGRPVYERNHEEVTVE